MTTDELWHYFEKNQIASSHPLDRTFIWIRRDDFTPIAAEFIKDLNLFHPGINLRSKEPWRHLHVIMQDDVVHAHLDTGNVAHSLVRYGLVHLWYDVVPYATHSLRHGVRISSWFILHRQ